MANASAALLDIQTAEASSVMVHHVPPAMVDQFLQWQRDITEVAQQFAGYARTEVYPPAESQHADWVVVVHFRDHNTLARWLESSERAQWISKLGVELAHFSTTMLPHGLGPWFAEAERGETRELPPNWKMALVVLLGLYPTVMLLTLLVAPRLTGLGPALSLLIGNFLSVALLQWAIMPQLTSALTRWLRPTAQVSRLVNIAGTLTVLALIGSLAALFYWLVG